MGARVRSLTIGVAIGSAFAVAGVCGTGAYLYSQHHYQELLDAARDSALARAELIRAALEKPRPRLKTRPSAASRKARLIDKRHHGELKRRRARHDVNPD